MADTQKKPSLMDRIKKEIAALFFFALGLILLLSLASFNNADPSFNNNLHPETIRNLGGSFGAHLSDLLFQVFGLTAFLLPLMCLRVAWNLFRLRGGVPHPLVSVSFVLMLFSLSGLTALAKAEIRLGEATLREAGGGIGRLLSNFLGGNFGDSGALLILLVVFLSTFMICTRVSLILMLKGLGRLIIRAIERRREKKAQAAAKAEAAPPKPKKEKRRKETPVEEPEARTEPAIVLPEPKYLPPPEKQKKTKGKAEEPQPTLDFMTADGSYRRPPLALLRHEGEAAAPVDREKLMENARILESKFRDFGVQGEVTEVKPGPVVTMYEFAPAPGVKVNKISGLSDDLALALKAQSIRIVAPIPGRGVVGIEIPNAERETVYLKEILESDEFQKTGGRLPMALGKDIFGRTVVSDLAKMPHVLVAGSTGSGKSVSINTMILSLVYHAAPEDVRIIMVDPKMLELSIYEGIPHLLLPVVTQPKKAALALNWAVREMERRYKLMADKGVRNIDGYNKKIALEEGRKAELAAQDILEVEALGDEAVPFEVPEGEELEHGHLPYIVVIVDELADLMMVAGREIEESIARLAQMARASGIHLILATQRPSVDVITGLIKANFPTRISFKVFSRIDSRTILDSMGAENLLGMGDMLFLPPGTGNLQRAHGAFVSEVEVQRVVDFLKQQAGPEYDASILAPPPGEGGGEGADDEGYDERWDDALALVAETRMASISMLQRRLRVGYNRAARMIEKMEQEGIVGPSDGTSRPREVFINKQG